MPAKKPGGPRRKRRHPLRSIVTAWAVLTLCAAALVFPGLREAEREGAPPSYLPGYGAALPEYVKQDLLPQNPYSRPGRYLQQVDGVVIHYVGNPGSSAKANRDYFASLASGRTGTYASSHFIVGLEGEVIQCVPLTEVAYASNHRNGDTVSIEVCHPDGTGVFSAVTRERVVELTAWLCGVFGVDPEEGVIRHYDVTGKICPKYYVEHPEAWDELRAAIAARTAEMAESGQPEGEQNSP